MEDEDFGNIVTIYDYKETDLYDEDLPSVEEFRSLPEYEWHIGAANKAQAEKLMSFLKEKIK